MANNTCANCGVSLDAHGAPIEDPVTGGAASARNRFCTAHCRDTWYKRNVHHIGGNYSGNDGAVTPALMLALVVLLVAASLVLGDGTLAPGFSKLQGAVRAAPENQTPSQQCVCPVMDLGGTSFVPGQFVASKVIESGLGFEEVFASTPTLTSGSGHARLYLLNTTGTKSGLYIAFDDGTYKLIAGN